MPKPDLDYSNTIIYKITCIDSANNDTYVGHTTNFVQRKHAHKQNCTNTRSANYNCKLYETIRNKGGWDNWKMEIINFFNCNTHYDARKKEQEYFLLLNANLNSIEPFPPQKTAMHTNVSNHVKVNYHCDVCNIKTRNKKDFNRHLLTARHIKETPGNLCIEPSIMPTCDCGKEFKSRSGLWKHKQKCTDLNTDLQNHFTESKPPTAVSSAQFEKLTNMIIKIVNENSEFKDLIVEQNKTIMELASKVGNNNTTNTNCNNKFNLNFFLNETCKDAINLTDFIRDINVYRTVS